MQTTTAPNAVQAGVESYQSRVDAWLIACFGETIARDRQERNHRFLEEALELVQACECTAGEAHQLVDYVFGRPVGEPYQESGGVSNTHAALCLAQGIDMDEAAETELARVWTKVEKIRAKQAAKPKHSPLPEAALTNPPGGGTDTLREVENQLYFLTSAESAAQWFTDRLEERDWYPTRPDIEAARNSIRNSTKAGRKLAALAAPATPAPAGDGVEGLQARIKSLEDALALEHFKNTQMSKAFWESSAGTDALRDVGLSEQEIEALATRPASQAPAASAGGEDAPLTSTEAVACWEAEQKIAPTAQAQPAGREEIARIIRAGLVGCSLGHYVDSKHVDRCLLATADAILDARPVADGGAEQWQGCDPDEPYDPLKCAIWAALVPFQNELLATGGVTFMGLRNAIVEAVQSFAIASQENVR